MKYTKARLGGSTQTTATRLALQSRP